MYVKHSRTGGSPRVIVVVLLAVIGAATTYQALLAAGVVGLGSTPGEGPPGADAALAIGLLAILLGAVVAAWLAGRGRPAGAAALLAPAAATFLVARFYSYDDYYLPTLRRASEGGILAPELVYGLLALALGAGILAGFWPRAGLALTVPTMLACGFFAWIAFAGH